MKTAVTLMSNHMLDVCRERHAHGLFNILSAFPMPISYKDNLVLITSETLPVDGWNGEVAYEIKKDDVGVYRITWHMIDRAGYHRPKNTESMRQNLVLELQDIGYEFGCPPGIRITDWLRVKLKEMK